MIRSFLKRPKKAHDAFQNRYPELSFFLRLSQKPSERPVIFQNDEIHEFEKVLTSSAKLIIVFGLGSGSYFKKASKWLKKSSCHEIVFIEENSKTLQSFLDQSYAASFFSHPQVHLRYVLNQEDINTAIDEISSEFFSEDIELVRHPSFRNDSEFKRLRELYSRRSIVYSSLNKEALFREKLFENFLPNYKQLSKAKDLASLKGSFKNIPVVICGAGPSLDLNLERIKALKNKAMIIAGGSAITALSKAGVEIDFAFAVDPNEEEYERLKKSHSLTAPLVFANRVHPRVFDCFNGELFYFKTGTGGPFESYLEKIMEITDEPFHKGMKDEGLSVTVLCLATAIALAFDPICFVGVDLAYLGNRRYAGGVVEDNDVFSSLESTSIIKKLNGQNKEVCTNLKWVMESEVISDFVKNHSSSRVYNASIEGLGFEGVDNLSLEAFGNLCNDTQDLKGLYHQKTLQARPLKPFENVIKEALDKLKISFSKCLEYADSILLRAGSIRGTDFENDPLISLYLIEFEAEDADLYFLKNLRDMLSPTFLHKHKSNSGKESFFVVKWKEIKLSIQSYLSLLDK